MSLHRIGAPRDTECQNLSSIFQKSLYQKRKAFFKSKIKVFFFRIEWIHSKNFLKKTIIIFSIYLHHLVDALDK